MNVKLKALVAALALSAVATSANAAISSNSGNSELVFSAWDANAGVGYTYDLNWDKFLNDLVGTDQTIANNLLLIDNAKVSSSMIGANGVIFDDVLTGFSFGDVSGVQWNLGAYDNSGRMRMLTTLSDGSASTSSSAQVRAAVSVFSVYTPANNGKITTPADDTFADTVNTDGAAFAGNLGDNFKNNTGDTTVLMGESSSLFLLAQSQQQASSPLAALQTQLISFDGRDIVAKTYLQDGAWRLQISAVTAVAAPVPEPETYAMMLAGLGLMGAVARRRTKSAK
ncbi:MAG: PEP-CTERM sorting domain-containing protein [Methylophilaceae bacterium]